MKPRNRFFQGQSNPTRGGASILSLALSLSIAAPAADVVWSGASDALWSNAANWADAAVPTAADTVVFDASSTANLTHDIGASVSVQGITLINPAGPVTVGGATPNMLTLGKGGINLSGATQGLTLNAPLTIASQGRQLWNIAAGQALTLAAVPNKPGIPANNTGVVQVSKTGSVTMGATTANIINDPQGNPFVTLGTDDWAGLNAGAVVASSYTAATTALTAGVVNDVKANLTGANGVDIAALRFNEATACDVTISNSGTARTATVRGILVTANSGGGSIGANLRNNGYIRPARSSTTGSSFNIIQNSAADFTIGAVITNASSSAPVKVVKSGPGKLIYLQDGGYSSGTYIDQGTVQFGNGVHTAGFPGSGEIVNHGAVIIQRAQDVTLANNISGSGSLTQAGTGTLSLTTSVSTFTGPVNVNAGTLAVTSFANLGNTSGLSINGAAFKFLGAFDPSATAITIGNSGATFDTNGNAITLINSFVSGSTGGLTKKGLGSLTISSDNDYSGGTVVSGGKLVVNAPTSGTGSGTVSVQSGASLGGSGVVGGAVQLASGAVLEPGDGAGTLTVTSLGLASGSLATFELAASGAGDLVAVTGAGGLSLDGTAIGLYQVGGTLPIATPGTYPLFSYSGSIGGAGISSLTVANPQPGLKYTFGTSGGFVNVTIETAGVVSQWVTDGSGSWGGASNWSTGIPNGEGATANFTTALTNPATVGLDGSRTVGAMSFQSAVPYTIETGSVGSLVIDNGSDFANVAVTDGIHTVSAPVTLASALRLSTVVADDGIVFGGIITGGATETLTKVGPGSLGLLADNDLSGPVTLGGGTTTFANGGLGTGPLAVSGATLAWAEGNSEDISSRAVTFGDQPVTFATGSSDVSFASAIGGGGTAALTKQGGGKLTLEADATFTGAVTIAEGSLQLGAGGNSGMVSGNIHNQGGLIIQRGDAVALANVISGTGTLTLAGAGSVTLQAANTFSGVTRILDGGLVLGNSAALQNSTLEHAADGGALSFGSLTAATLGGLSGNGDIALELADQTALALTVGGNGSTTTYAGVLSGAGSLTKTGVGVLTLSGAQTYAGATNVNAGKLELQSGASTSGQGPVAVTGTGGIAVLGGDLAATTGLFGVGTTGLLLDGGTATFTGAVSADDSAGSTDSGPIKVISGTLNAASIALGRGGAIDASAAGPVAAPADKNLYILGGEVNISGNLSIGTAWARPNSTVVTRIDGGALNVGGAVSVGLNNGGRWSILDVNGGEFTSTGTAVDSGVVLSGPYVGRQAFLVRSGTATVERVQFGRGAIGGWAQTNLIGGQLNVGSGGLVIGSTEPTFQAELLLSGGTLAAKADFTCDVPVKLTGADVFSTVLTEDGAGTPFTVTITAPVTGNGSLDKDGAGTLVLAGDHSHTGSTTVIEGTLELRDASLADTAQVIVGGQGAELKLAFNGGDRVGSFRIGTVDQADGVYGSMTNNTPGIVQTPAITGSGLLYVNTEVPVITSAYAAWATAKGLTAGTNDGAGQDPDLDGLANALEFALGGNPLANDAAAVAPAVARQGGDFVFSFRRGDESEAEVGLKFQHSGDLATWTDLVVGADTASSGAGVVVTENGADPDLITVTLSGSGKARLFGRLQATK
jgi:fibronectin-binding autotransporter adhesin